MKVKFRLSSIQQVTTALSVLGKDMKQATKRGVQKHVDIVGDASLLEVPVDTTDLFGSQKRKVYERPVVHGVIDYTDWKAVFVHEIPAPPHESVGGRSARHDAPTKWRYLADPFNREERNYLQRVADECGRELRRARRAAR